MTKIIFNGKPFVLKKCIVCGKEFQAKGRQKTCGHLCSDHPKNLNSKKRKKFQKFLDSI